MVTLILLRFAISKHPIIDVIFILFLFKGKLICLCSECTVSVLCRCFFQGWGLFRTPSTSWEHVQNSMKQPGDDCDQLSRTVSEDPAHQPAAPEAGGSDGGHQLLINSERLSVGPSLAAEVI